jgi:nucleoside-diphosphate-sugar epimerase
MIVVTGSESFIGRVLTARLDRADKEWIGLDVATQAPRSRAIDIRDGEVGDAIPEGADALVHLAAISRDADCRERPREAFDVNVNGTLNLLEASRRRGIKQFILASSEWVYGEVVNDAEQTEASPIDAARLTGEYAISKLSCERLVATAVQRGTIPASAILRFGIVYGPRPANWSAVEMLYDAVAKKDVVEVKGSLSTARRFIHVEDIAEGILAAVGQPGHHTWNLSGDRLITLGSSRKVSGSLGVLLRSSSECREPPVYGIRSIRSRSASWAGGQGSIYGRGWSRCWPIPAWRRKSRDEGIIQCDSTNGDRNVVWRQRVAPGTVDVGDRYLECDL